MSESKVKATFRGPSWDVLHIAIHELLNQLQNQERNVFVLSFVVEGFEPNPYVQGVQTPTGDFLFEVVGDYWLEPDLSKLQVAQLNALGWSRPTADSSNFSKVIGGRHDLMATATYLVTSMRVVFNLKRDVWMTLGDTKLDRELVLASGFWLNNRNRDVFCMPYENKGDASPAI